MMMVHNTQYNFVFPFGPQATEIEQGKSAAAETMPKKAATLDARFCQFTFTGKTRAALQICLWRWLAMNDAPAPTKTICKSTNS
jgi:hypothetical protein